MGWCVMSERAVALSDVVKRHFDGQTFAAGAALGEAQRQGWIVREKAAGPKGGTYTVIVATPAGAARAASLWARAGRPDQRVHSGAVKASEMRHEVAVYRAASAAHARIEAEGGRVVRVRIDAELKGEIAARAERARVGSLRLSARPLPLRLGKGPGAASARQVGEYACGATTTVGRTCHDLDQRIRSAFEERQHHHRRLEHTYEGYQRALSIIHPEAEQKRKDGDRPDRVEGRIESLIEGRMRSRWHGLDR